MESFDGTSWKTENTLDTINLKVKNRFAFI